MRILVVDDFVLVELALAQIIQDTPHTLTGVRDPRNLPEALAQGPRFDLALVDLNFGPGVPTGLTAMRILRDLSPGTGIVIESTDEERNRLLRFDGRTLVALGAIALSLTGYVLQDARSSTRRDADIESMKARITTLERVAATNTEARIRTEVQLGELHQGQEEIKAMIAAHDLATKKAMPRK